jgi:hypothetical protein
MFFENGGETGDETRPCGWDARSLYLGGGLSSTTKVLALDFEGLETKPFLSVLLHALTPPTNLPERNNITPIGRSEFPGTVRRTSHQVPPRRQ